MFDCARSRHPRSVAGALEGHAARLDASEALERHPLAGGVAGAMGELGRMAAEAEEMRTALGGLRLELALSGARCSFLDSPVVRWRRCGVVVRGQQRGALEGVQSPDGQLRGCSSQPGTPAPSLSPHPTPPPPMPGR